MSDNIFIKIRNSQKGKWKEPLTQSALAKKLGIRQQTVAKAESGETPSYNTVKMYHEKLGVPYKTLFGNSTAMKEENVNINEELGLSDEAIETIRKLSPNELAFLNNLLGNELSAMKLERWYNLLESIHTLNKLLENTHTLNKLEENRTILKHELNNTKHDLSKSVTKFLINDVLPKLF